MPDGVTVRGGKHGDGRPSDGMTYVADCRVSSIYRSYEETQANARLVAAAPELYAALVASNCFIDADEPPAGCACMRCAAIAKAGG
jgi:hypothetical protein